MLIAGITLQKVQFFFLIAPCYSTIHTPNRHIYLSIYLFFNSINKHSSSDVADYLETYRLHILHR